jgi:hypothetical protein
MIYNAKKKSSKVFLGGTCNNSTWRDRLIPMLKVDYFNPVVKDWTPECQQEEINQREKCDIVLYCLTPLMLGVYSVAEVVDDSNKRPSKTVLVCLKEDNGKEFNKDQWKSMLSLMKMVTSNKAAVFATLEDVAIYINNGGIYK